MGRFISEDPLGFGGGDVSWHAYVQNDPVNWLDPWGLSKWYPVPGKKGWEVRRDQPLNPDVDYPHDHYRYRGKDIPRKVNSKTGEQKEHGKGKCTGEDKDVPQDVIDAAKKGFKFTGDVQLDLNTLEGIEAVNDALDEIRGNLPQMPILPIPGYGGAPIPIFAVP